MILNTIGYEGMTIESFFVELLNNNVNTVVDVREIPISHKYGFSKSGLLRFANANDLNYIHLPELGCPKEIRHDYRNDKDWSKYSRRFLTYLSFQEKGLQNLAEIIQKENCCLLCFEADYHFCHRFYVANAVSRLLGHQLKVNHLSHTEKAKAVSRDFLVGIPLQ